MRVFPYEFFTAGDWQSAGDFSPAEAESMRLEGGAMLAAVVADFAAIEGTQVMRMEHAEVQSLGAQVAFDRLAAQADWTLVIAPETHGLLAAYARRAVAAGGRLLGPGPELIELCADKQRLAEHLTTAGILVPDGRPIEVGAALPSDFIYPAVLKPRDGAGSMGIQWIENANTEISTEYPCRLEPFCPGMPVSVAVLCGPKVLVALPACRQNLSSDGRFSYLGGSLPLSPGLAARAQRLAEAAIGTLHDPVGYLGIDMVLGGRADGGEDFVIEINPRLTTSYIGLRAASRTNLAQAMLTAARGEPPDVSFAPGGVQFLADGRTQAMARQRST